MITRRGNLAIGAAVMLCLGLTAPVMASQQLAKSDAAFLKTVAARQQSEIELSELAMARAGSDQVKHFAERMIQDHTKASQELHALISTLGAALPHDAPRSLTQQKGKLSGLSGAAFDRAYLRHQIADHKKNVSEFAATSKKLKNPQVREWAFATLPVLKEHFLLAKGLAAKSAAPVSK